MVGLEVRRNFDGGAWWVAIFSGDKWKKACGKLC
jgi:hypothetical protein